MSKYEILLQQMQYAIAQNTMPQAVLLIGSAQAQMITWVNRVIAECVCESDNKPCEHCSSCVMLREGIHPDVNYLAPEGPSSSIKIETIRELQLDIYKTPQRANKRFVVFHQADHLNRAAANALLKIVEEPPAHAVYFFIAQYIERIPATLVSRCQRHVFSSPEQVSCASLLTERVNMVKEFFAFLHSSQDACSLAQAWDTHSLDDLLGFLYTITALLIREIFMPSSPKLDWIEPYTLPPVHLFMQLDNIQQTKRSALNHPALNKTLAIEQILLHYRGDFCDG